MNRKTNVFYLTGNDSRFLTFDNYTDALTGDIIATNQKLWPSRFLCINIENLTTENKENFIKNFLIKYYENKLAFLRDNLLENDEEYLTPLTYLLEIICFYGANESIKKYNSEANIFNIENNLQEDDPNYRKHKTLFNTIEELEKDLYNHYRTFNINKSQELMTYIKESYGVDFCYIGDIVEQDYNGTYADIICTITPNNRKMPLFGIDKDMIFEIKDDEENYIGCDINRDYDNDGDIDIREYENENILFGWDSDTDQLYIKNYLDCEELNLPFDIKGENSTNNYFIKPIIKTLDSTDNPDSITFNIIIPLFDSTYINGSDIDNDITNEIIISNCKSVPLGIYFCDKPIILNNDVNGYSSNWSLLISTQFKPFPYSYNITHNFDDSDSIKNAYITFAEILAKQTNFIDLLNKYNDTVIGLSNRISILESIINSISSVQNIDELYQSILALKNNTNNSINGLQNQINELKNSIEQSKLKWQIKNNE